MKGEYGMGKVKLSNATASELTALEPPTEISYKHGEMKRIRISDIEPNPWNPNEMSAEQFNLLSENITEVDFLDPILVVPLPKKPGERQKYRIVDGEHRWEQQRLCDAKDVPCIVVDPKRFPEREQMRQVIRMNKIRGEMNVKKFAALANLMMERYGVPYEDLAHEFGFVDEDELSAMLDAARETLPNEEAKKEFDKAREEIKTVEDLSLVLNRLFSKYGNTLPANFMVLDFGGKEHIWVRIRKREFRGIVDKARLCKDEGVTFDSVLCRMLNLLNIKKFVEQHRDFLEEIKTEQ